MKDEIIVQKYTRALFEVADEHGVLKEVEAGLKRVDETFKKLPELAEYFTLPQVEWKFKLEMSANLAKGLSPFIVNFIRLVMEKERQFILPDVPAEFRRMVALREKRSEAVVTTVAPLPDVVKKALEDKLREMFAEEFVLQNRLDPEIIGGLKIQLGYTLIDGTIKRKLEDLGRLLAKG